MDASEPDLSTAFKVFVNITMVLPVVVDGLDQALPLLVVVAPDLHVINWNSCVGDHELAVPWVATLVTEPEGGVSHRALHRVPLNLPSAIPSLLQIQVAMGTFRALITDEAILVAGGDWVAAQPLAHTPELHAHTADCCAKILCPVDGKGHSTVAWRVTKAMEVETAMAEAPGSVTVVGPLAIEVVAEEGVPLGAHAQGKSTSNAKLEKYGQGDCHLIELQGFLQT